MIGEGILEDEYAIRRLAVEHNIPVVTTLELASAIVEAFQYLKSEEPEILALSDYVPMTDPQKGSATRNEGAKMSPLPPTPPQQ